jgi:hypothetical protein
MSVTNYFNQLTEAGKEKVLSKLPRPHAKNKTLYRRVDNSGDVSHVAINSNIAISDTQNFKFIKTTLAKEKQYLAQQIVLNEPLLVEAAPAAPKTRAKK